MSNTRKIGSVLLYTGLLACALHVPVLADSHTWTGLGGDHLWSNPQNWVNAAGEVLAPENFDSVTIQKGSGDEGVDLVAVTNDLPSSVRFWGVTVAGETPVLVSGNTIKANSLTCKTSTTVDADLIFDYVKDSSAYHIFCCSADTTLVREYVFNGAIALRADCDFLLTAVPTTTDGTTHDGSRAKIYFKGPLDLGGQAFNPSCVADIYFDAPLIVPSIAKSVLKGGYDSGWRKKSLHFRCSGNHMDAMENYRLDSFHIETENAFDDTTTLGFPTDNSNNWVDGNQVIFLGGRDQTIGQLVSGINCVYADPARPAATGFCVYSGATKTEDAASTLTLKACRDASCYIQLMGNLSLVYDPVGDFTQTFSNRAHTLSGPIVVKGGTLKFSGTTTLKNVTSVKVLGTGRLMFEGCTENPFTAANTTLEIDETARLELSEGTEISVRNLIVGGERVKVAEYTSGTLPQIVGGGKIVVASEAGVSYWMGTKNSAWGEADNWDNGVPSKTACFERPGTWRVDTAGITLPTALGLDMTNPSADTTTVVVAESVAFNGAKFSLGRNSVLEIADTANVTFSNSKVEIAEDGSAVLAGGTTTFETGTPTLKGGSLCATGASTLVLAATGGTTPFATGYTYFGGDSELRNASTKNYNLWYFTPNAAGEICRVEFADRAYFNGRPGNVVDSFVLNNGRSGAQTFFTMRDHAHGELCLALQIAKGNGTYAEMAMADSAYAHVLYYGVNIATGGTDVNNPAKGVLKMTGGALDVQSQKADAASSRHGIVVGDGSGAEADGYANVGEVQLAGGVISNRVNGVVTIGVGSGKGLVHQTGGEFQSRNYYPIVLGLRGGCGRYEIEDGLFFANGDVYVGGCPTGTVGSAYVNLPADKVGQGTLSVSGGVFTARNLYVSQEGQGSMVVGGGSISVNNLTLGSSTDSATGHSCVSSLTFSLGDDGAHGLISVKNTLTLADNVQLVVDFGDYKGKFVKLLTANAVTGGFVPENITFRGTYKDRGQILFREGVLWAGVQQGLAISFR